MCHKCFGPSYTARAWAYAWSLLMSGYHLKSTRCQVKWKESTMASPKPSSVTLGATNPTSPSAALYTSNMESIYRVHETILLCLAAGDWTWLVNHSSCTTEAHLIIVVGNYQRLMSICLAEAASRSRGEGSSAEQLSKLWISKVCFTLSWKWEYLLIQGLLNFSWDSV